MKKKFQEELNKLLVATEKMGGRAIEIRADYLYSRVEGYIYNIHKMSICANVLRENVQNGDKILVDPPKNDEWSLKVKFHIPRRKKNSQNIS